MAAENRIRVFITRCPPLLFVKLHKETREKGKGGGEKRIINLKRFGFISNGIE
jgi:hypothetical protein